MIDKDKHNVLGILINAIDYEAAVERIIQSAHASEPLSVSALAVHGVMTGVLDPEQAYRLNHLDLVVPDGQPVRWALNLLHRAELQDRVYGPTLMLNVCDRAAQEGLPIYLYGSRIEVLTALQQNLNHCFPTLKIAGMQPSRFRQLSETEQLDIAREIQDSGAQIVFVGLGCPRQEVWAYENQSILKMPILAVGAAFDFHAQLLAQAPAWMQKLGLEWVFRLIKEPRRLWRRYAFLNPLYLWYLCLQFLGLIQLTKTLSTEPKQPIRFG
jgi:N-acetylglucosaminyldiphosphoundecaprenol N-acetyl-beta-D-mannosaminyltransferase